jgi:hypothetical protein
MWSQPYLETCCRAALHRLVLAADVGRPPAMKDGPCLVRLAEMGFCRLRADERYEVTPAGEARHATEILHPAAGQASGARVGPPASA